MMASNIMGKFGGFSDYIFVILVIYTDIRKRLVRNKSDTHDTKNWYSVSLELDCLNVVKF